MTIRGLFAILAAMAVLFLAPPAPADEEKPIRVIVPNLPLDGRLRQTRPRLLLPGLFDGWDGEDPPPAMRRRLTAYEQAGLRLPGNPCRLDHVGPLTVCLSLIHISEPTRPY